MGNGGLSGKPLRDRSTDILQYLYAQSGTNLPLVGSGGIFTAADARDKLDAGATLLEIWTGFIYVGPGLAKTVAGEGGKFKL
jgi:dihydroorotate dehydrogenase